MKRHKNTSDSFNDLVRKYSKNNCAATDAMFNKIKLLVINY